MIDTKRVCEMFGGRARDLYGKVEFENITMFQEGHGDLAQRRDAIEYEAVMSYIGDHLNQNMRVLDVGCGAGRWAFHLAPHVGHIEAFDFSLDLISVARKEAVQRCIDNISFKVECIETFAYPHKFNVIVISGVFLFLNDAHLGAVMSHLRQASLPQCWIVVREACGSAGRYEIFDVWSHELETLYSAIYRDPDWFRGAFCSFCDLVDDKPLFPPELERWPETHQHLFIFRGHK